MNWGEFIAFMFIPDLIELITKQLEVFTSATRRTIPACHIMRSLVCKYFNPNRFRVVFQFLQGHVRNVLITPPPWRFLSFLNMLYGHVSGNNSKVAIGLSIFVSWIATIWGLWTSRKANKSNFLPLILFIFKLMNFSPPREFVWFVRFDAIPSFFFLCYGIKSILIHQIQLINKERVRKAEKFAFSINPWQIAYNTANSQ